MSDKEDHILEPDEKEEFGYQPHRRGHQPKEDLDTSDPPDEASGVPEKKNEDE